MLHFRRHAVMATLFILIYYVAHTLDISFISYYWLLYIIKETMHDKCVISYKQDDFVKSTQKNGT